MKLPLHTSRALALGFLSSGLPYIFFSVQTKKQLILYIHIHIYVYICMYRLYVYDAKVNAKLLSYRPVKVLLENEAFRISR